MSNLKIFTTVLLIFLFFSPVIGSILSMIGQDVETNQYAGLQWMVMGVYNFPFIIVSLSTLLLGERYLKKEKMKVAATLFCISIVSSIVGTVAMIIWGLGLFM